MAKKEKDKWYRLVGTSNAGEVVDRIILKGSSSNPKQWIDSDMSGILSDEQLARLTTTGHILEEVDAPEYVNEPASNNDEPKGGDK
jgi:hypothetical protein